MQRLFIFMILIVWAGCLFNSCTDKQTFAREDKLADFFDLHKVTIAVTDSGLGGLSVTADAVNKMKKHKVFSNADFLFFSSLFSNSGGYNSLPSREEKIRVFNSALHSLEKNYTPDIILIACNTLSVLYSDTDFARTTATPVIGIVSAGVDMIAEKLKANPEAGVIIFGTQTTVEEGTHKAQLLEKGFLSDRIITQSCPDLVPYIERGYDSDETEMLILAYVDESLQKARNGVYPLYVSFNCTHYGYSLKLWKDAFHSLGVKPHAYLNPNLIVANILFQPGFRNRYSSTNISVKVVSMVKIGPEKRASIGKYLAEISPETASALQNYELKPDLFTH